jgi:hypothetical protein
MSERRFRGDRFNFGIQGLLSYSTGRAFILYPERDQAPGKELNLGRIIIGNDRQLGIRECRDMEDSFKKGIDKRGIKPPFDCFTIFTQRDMEAHFMVSPAPIPKMGLSATVSLLMTMPLLWAME